ncbi:hypothetical protein BDF14DRAFT_619657 [Spinellus fusiger]|nr:hypothetical protein BDF14DRAFT_619657 [Spinellus fusiger]
MSQKHSELPSFDFESWLPSCTDTLNTFSDDLIKQFDSKRFIIKSEVVEAIQQAPEDTATCSPLGLVSNNEDPMITATKVSTSDKEEAIAVEEEEKNDEEEKNEEWEDRVPPTSYREEPPHQIMNEEPPHSAVTDKGLEGILNNTTDSFLGSIASAEYGPIDLKHNAYIQEKKKENNSISSSVYTLDRECFQDDIDHESIAEYSLPIPTAHLLNPREMTSMATHTTLATLASTGATGEEIQEEIHKQTFLQSHLEAATHTDVSQSLSPCTLISSPASTLLLTPNKPSLEETPSKSLLHKSSAFFRQRMTKFKKGQDTVGPPPMPRNISSFSLSHDKATAKNYPPKPLHYSPVDPPSDDVAHRKSLPVPSKSRTTDVRVESKRHSEPQPVSTKPRRSFFSQLLHRGTT